jgi:transcriptional antiterminator
MKHEVMEYFPQTYQLAARIIPSLQQHVPVAIPDDEIAFIAMHIMAALERSRIPLKALFIYDQTFSEIKYALSLVENHLAEVEIQKTLQVNDLNQTMLEEIDIVFSTFPLQLKDVHCFVFPLIPDVKFITTLKSTLTLLFEQINDQRLKLSTVT